MPLRPDVIVRFQVYAKGWQDIGLAGGWLGEQDGDLPGGFPNEAAIQRIHVPSTTELESSVSLLHVSTSLLLSTCSLRAWLSRVCRRSLVSPAEFPTPAPTPTHGSEKLMRCTRAREPTDPADRQSAGCPRILAGNPFESLVGNRDARSVPKLINGNTRAASTPINEDRSDRAPARCITLDPNSPLNSLLLESPRPINVRDVVRDFGLSAAQGEFAGRPFGTRTTSFAEISLA